MTAKHEVAGGRVVVSPEGRIDTETVKSFRALIDGAVKTAGCRIIVDLTRVDYITSAGLGAIIRAAQEARAKDGTVVLCGAAGCVREVIEISGLARIIPTTVSLEEALNW